MRVKLQFMLLISILFTTFQLSALTFTVNVPEGTNTVYVAGTFNGWSTSSHQMTKVTNPQYTLENVTVIQYKLVCGPSWDYEEVKTDGSKVDDRSATIASPNATITVENW